MNQKMFFIAILSLSSIACFSSEEAQRWVAERKMYRLEEKLRKAQDFQADANHGKTQGQISQSPDCRLAQSFVDSWQRRVDELAASQQQQDNQ